jgi:hypothetical protein
MQEGELQKRTVFWGVMACSLVPGDRRRRNILLVFSVDYGGSRFQQSNGIHLPDKCVSQQSTP